MAGPRTTRPILLVDDEVDIRDALGELLRDEGFTVVTAPNGHEAMLWLAERRPPSCVVLLDLMMPVMNGTEFLQKKQGDPAISTHPVIIVTASIAALQIAPTPDIKACISKPIEMDQLWDALDSCA
jgi:CheY-like chemotaxis protein